VSKREARIAWLLHDLIAGNVELLEELQHYHVLICIADVPAQTLDQTQCFP
jgi:hypothetical protein